MSEFVENEKRTIDKINEASENLSNVLARQRQKDRNILKEIFKD